ncbi:ExbD/TolR family protein [Sulfuriroseicoccus oceanibius]|uniref:Biopolymer transporter ExbD n=1 Tax=Sulfuriroseicoccus oceanibius TaxID=2707525 RepID=A0A6B3L305_9BACT|nr:biopolymer transporter ExbD [Sulfuriroseicoccus oceanibius]QQL46219.1 biopolymer transporter ExbD [Sulfuriroseicoccus oceanibius]
MNILTRKRHRPVVPVLSMIDILAILLIFFVVTMQFKTEDDQDQASESAQTTTEEQTVVERRLDIELPTASNIGGTAAAPADVVISIDQQGKVFVDGNEAPTPLEMHALLEERKVMSNGLARFELEPDRRAPLGTLITVWDVLTAAGIDVKDVPARLQGAAE